MSQSQYPTTGPLNSNKLTNNQNYTPIDKNSRAQINNQPYQVTHTITIHQIQDVQSVDQHNQRYSIRLEQNQQHQVDQQNCEFKVCVHQVKSDQNLSYDGCHQRYSINFTKSQINIPIQFMSQADQHTNLDPNNDKKQNINRTYFSQNNDFNIKHLEQKFNKKQQEEVIMNKLIQSLQSNYLQTNSQPNQNKINKKNQRFQVKPQQNQIKKINFKIKRLVDRQNFRTANIKPSKTPVETKAYQNTSEVISLQQNEANNPYVYNRRNNKHVSNFESGNKSSQKSLLRKEPKQKIKYQISLGNSVEMISHILEDRCYNSLNHNSKQEIGQGKNDRQQSGSRLKKVVKRSPYGILQIEAKHNKNTTKVTNLRILKPKEIIRLKKIPNISKSNKQNFAKKLALQNHMKNSLKNSQKQSNITQIVSDLLALN